jgi:hypothetical protein
MIVDRTAIIAGATIITRLVIARAAIIILILDGGSPHDCADHSERDTGANSPATIAPGADLIDHVWRCHLHGGSA